MPDESWRAELWANDPTPVDLDPAEVAKRPRCGRWYVTAAAVNDWTRIAGHPDTRTGFDRAAAELRRLCGLARFVREYGGGRFESWRVKARTTAGKVVRLDLAVSVEMRPEGHHDQLVAVKDNDDRRR